METRDEFEERLRREQQIAARLRLATERLEEAQRERIWAIVEAHQAGLSVRQIATATGLSSSRVHQLLGSDEAREIPRWLSQQRRRGRRDPVDVFVGDAIDFWRVEDVIPGERLLLHAEMKVPGDAWLEFRVRPLGAGGDRSELVQTAYGVGRVGLHRTAPGDRAKPGADPRTGIGPVLVFPASPRG